MEGNTSTNFFTIYMILLLSISTIHCGFFSNSAIKRLIKIQKAKARTTPAPTSSRTTKPTRSIGRPTNTTLPNRLEDVANRMEEDRMELPSCKRADIYLTDPYKDECYFLRCDVPSGRYVRRKCPDGTAVPKYYMRRRNGQGKKSDHVPCIKTSSTCTPTFASQGVERPVVLACGIDLVFAVDVSCSITDTNKFQIQRFLMSVADVVDVGPLSTRIGIVSFSKKIFHVAFLNQTQNKFQYKRAVKQMNLVLEPGRNLRRDCGTSTNVALESVRLDYFTQGGGDRPDRPNVLFVLSDGLTVPVQNKNLTILEAKKLKKMNIPTYVMGLPNQRQIDLNRRDVYIGDEEWYAIASKPENVFKMQFDSLARTIASLASEVCAILN